MSTAACSVAYFQAACWQHTVIACGITEADTVKRHVLLSVYRNGVARACYINVCTAVDSNSVTRFHRTGGITIALYFPTLF